MREKKKIIFCDNWACEGGIRLLVWRSTSCIIGSLFYSSSSSFIISLPFTSNSQMHAGISSSLDIVFPDSVPCVKHPKVNICPFLCTQTGRGTEALFYLFMFCSSVVKWIARQSLICITFLIICRFWWLSRWTNNVFLRIKWILCKQWQWKTPATGSSPSL